MNASNIEVYPIPALKDNYIWAIVNKNTQTTIIVDPGEAKPVEDFLKLHTLSLVGILITHHHWDHTNGVEELKKNEDGLIYGPLNDFVSSVTNPLEDNDNINFSEFPFSLKAIAIPAHTLGHMAYYGNGMLFSGDTLFAAGCGRVFEGSPQQMYTSLQKLAQLPEDTKVYCGHEYTLNNLKFAELVEPGNTHVREKITRVTKLREKGIPSLPSTIKEEKETNPFLRCNSPEIIASVESYAKLSFDKSKDNTTIQVFTLLREWKNSF